MNHNTIARGGQTVTVPLTPDQTRGRLAGLQVWHDPHGDPFHKDRPLSVRVTVDGRPFFIRCNGRELVTFRRFQARALEDGGVYVRRPLAPGLRWADILQDACREGWAG